jgi:hypothetical protein
METRDVIAKHEQSFNKIRLLVKLLLVVLFAFIAALQYQHIISILKWLWNNI